MSFYGGGTIRVVLLTDGLILAGYLYFSLYIDTSSYVGLYTLSVTVIFATDTGVSKTPLVCLGVLQTHKIPPGSASGLHI